MFLNVSHNNKYQRAYNSHCTSSVFVCYISLYNSSYAEALFAVRAVALNAVGNYARTAGLAAAVVK